MCLSVRFEVCSTANLHTRTRPQIHIGTHTHTCAHSLTLTLTHSLNRSLTQNPLPPATPSHTSTHAKQTDAYSPSILNDVCVSEMGRVYTRLSCWNCGKRLAPAIAMRVHHVTVGEGQVCLRLLAHVCKADVYPGIRATSMGASIHPSEESASELTHTRMRTHALPNTFFLANTWVMRRKPAGKPMRGRP